MCFLKSKRTLRWDVLFELKKQTLLALFEVKKGNSVDVLFEVKKDTCFGEMVANCWFGWFPGPPGALKARQL